MSTQYSNTRAAKMDRLIQKMQPEDEIVVGDLHSLGLTVEEALYKIQFLLNKNCLIKVLNFGTIEKSTLGLENFAKLEQVLLMKGLSFNQRIQENTVDEKRV